jgi:hypothetical protein
MYLRPLTHHLNIERTDMNNVPFFTTRKHSEAERLLGILRASKPKKHSAAFSIHPMAGTHSTFAICCNTEGDELVDFAGFLKGYLAAEAQKRRTDRLYSRLRAAHRRG